MSRQQPAPSAISESVSEIVSLLATGYLRHRLKPPEAQGKSARSGEKKSARFTESGVEGSAGPSTHPHRGNDDE